MSKIIGLTFLSPKAVKLVFENDPYQDEWSVELCPSDRYKKWIRADSDGRKRLALLTDKAYFQTILKSKIDYTIAFCPWTWLKSRGITVLDAKEYNDRILCNAIKPIDLSQALLECGDHTPSVHDRWIARGAPRGTKREDVSAEDLYQTYSLANLIHIVLNRADESLLMKSPKEFWIATYEYAVGKMTKKKWTSHYGRILKSAGVSQKDLHMITQWAQSFGKSLSKGQVEKPVSTLDKKIVSKYLDK